MSKRSHKHVPHDGVAPHAGTAEATLTAPAEAAAVPSPPPDLGYEVSVPARILAVDSLLAAPWSEPTVGGQPAQLSGVDALLDAGVVEAALPPPDPNWAPRVRAFARPAVWAVPGAAVALSVASVWGVPRPHDPPAGASPGAWLMLTAFGLGLALVGAIALTTLVIATPGRGWALTGLVLAVLGTVLSAPALGVIGLARPAAEHLGDKPAAAFEADLAGGTVMRWLGVGGLLLLAAGWALLACAILASRVLNRGDGYLLLAAVAFGLAAVGLSTPLLTISALALLAAGLGLGWTIGRTAPEIH